MQNKPFMTIEDAKSIAEAAEAEAHTHSWRVSIVVVDAAGIPLLLHRLDGAPLHTPEVALKKGQTAAITRSPSKGLEDKILAGRVTLLSMPNFLPIEGGEPVFVGTECVGAVGVSGAQSQEDAQIARAGIAALRIVTP